MRPVNLVPSEIKRRRGRRDTGFAPYAVIAVLAAAVIGVLGYTVIGNQATSKEAEVAKLSHQLRKANAQAAELSGYGKFAAMKQIRVLGVTTVAASRFSWARILQNVSRALPHDAWLVEATGKVSKEAKTGEGGDSASSSGSSGDSGGGSEEEIDVPGPTLKLTGCTYRQRHLARMMTRLRNISGVAQVLLSSSEEKEEQDTGSGGGDNECRTRPRIHKFVVTLTFRPTLASELIGSQSNGGEAPSQEGTDQGGTGGTGSEGSTSGSAGASPASSPTQATGAGSR